MKTKHYKFLTLFVFFVILGASAHSEDLRKIVSLSGNWKFSIGDDSKWSSPSYDDSGWDQITVPGQWENQGYNDYNGYAWYRKSFRVREIPSNTTIYLLLGKIDDVDIVYLNGREIGRSGKFPPDFKTAYDRDRRYIVPADHFCKVQVLSCCAVIFPFIKIRVAPIIKINFLIKLFQFWDKCNYGSIPLKT